MGSSTPCGAELYRDSTGECYIRFKGEEIVIYMENGGAAEVAKETDRYLKFFKTPIEIQKRDNAFQYNNWCGTSLSIYVPDRKTHLFTVIVAKGEVWVFLSAKGRPFQQTPLPYLLDNLEVSVKP